MKTARYGEEAAGRELSSEERNALLLSNLNGVQGSDRSAAFQCAMALVLSPERIYVFQESLEGEIAVTTSGSGGFGYDPVFFLPERGVNLAEVSDAEKNEISHRGKAAAALSEMLNYLERGELA